jgi:hypothetical protein
MLKSSLFTVSESLLQASQNFDQHKLICVQKVALLTRENTKILNTALIFLQLEIYVVHPALRISKRRSHAQVTILPVMNTIKALFSNAEISHSIQHHDQCLKSALDIVGHLVSGDTTTPRTYCDFGDSAIHEYHYRLGLFQDCRDIAFVLSTDGVQLTMKKHSNTWLLILTILNLPPDIHYKCGVIINLATPVPNSPGLIETFI